MHDLFNPYWWAIRIRNWLYDRGFIKVCRQKVPVISVGNLSVGGSGKSSLVRHIASLLCKDVKVCILSRGYRRKTRGTLLVSEWGKILAGWEEAGDEPYMLAKLLPEVSVIVDEKRCRGAGVAIERLKPELIILDDGFQHRKIHRDLDILLLRKRDFSDRLLPFGRLREPLSAMERAHLLILSYAELEDFDWRHPSKPTLKMERLSWKIFRSTDHRELTEWKDMSFVAFSGLGDNEQFFRSLAMLGVRLEKTISLPDHYHYRGFLLEKDRFYITTLKDVVKIPPAENLFYVDFELRVEGLKKLLDEFIIKKLLRVGSSAGRATDS